MQMLVDLEIVFLYDISEMPFANYTFSVFRVLRISSVNGHVFERHNSPSGAMAHFTYSSTVVSRSILVA